MGLLDGILSTAASLEMDPLDLATIISYETAGTFDPAKRGPTTQWGQHRGLIQFGEPQAKEYGVDWDDPLGSQLGPDGAVANYFKANGWKPGMGMLDAYSIVNAGGPGLYNRSDANNGGAPGTVKDKVQNQMSGHRAKAQALLGNDDQQIADGAMRAIGKDPIRQTSTATAIGGQGADTMQQSTGLLGQLARPEEKVGGLLGMMFKNMTPDRADQIRAGLAGLYGNENPGIYNAATQRMGDRKAQRREDTALARQQAEQQQAEAQAAQQREAAARWATQNGSPQLAKAIMDGLVSPSKVYELANPEQPKPTDDMREYQAAQAQGFTGTLQEWILSQRKAGAASNTVTVGGQPSNIGTIPQGYAAIPDETEPSGYRMVPVPGGPEDTTAQDAVKVGNASVATDTIITAADRARQAAAKQNFGSSGTSLVGMLPFTDSAEVIRQVDVLKSQAKVSNLQSMRDASKTGGALGAVSAPELKMLEDQSGALDPNSPNFLRDLDQYEKTLLNVVHGPEAGARIYLETRKDPAGAPKVLRFNADAPPPATVRKTFNPATGKIE